MASIETIGDATLYLGDCREILPTLGKIDAVVTDPPYGIDYKASQPGAINYGRIIGDNNAFNPNHISGDMIIWGANNFSNQLPHGGWIVWDKRCSAAADRMLGSPFELAWCSNDKIFKMIRIQHGGAKNADAFNGDVANESRFHPTQKPVKVMTCCIEFLGSPKNIIADPYMGSGSTGIAAIRLGRKFIGIEIEPKYFDIACRRIDEAARQPDMFIEQTKSLSEQYSYDKIWNEPFYKDAK